CALPIYQARAQIRRSGHVEHQPRADSARQRQQLRRAQPREQTLVASEHDGEDAARVEACLGQQPQLGKHLVVHLLGLVDQQHRARQRALDVRHPFVTKRAKAGPAIVRFERDTEELSHLPIEIGDSALGPLQYRYAQVALTLEPRYQQAQRRALAAADAAVDQREAAFGRDAVLESPAEVVDARAAKQRVVGDVRAEGIEFEAIEGL